MRPAAKRCGSGREVRCARAGRQRATLLLVPSHRRALLHLRKADPVLARVIDQVGACRFATTREGTHFDAVVRAIVYQQLSGKAAATILRRVHDVYGGKPPTARRLLATADAPLRAAGLSQQKLGYLRDLAEQAVTRKLAFARLDTLDDEAVVEALTRVKGVGRWTAQMFLMFRLGRLDILPTGDLGIQNAVQRAWGLAERPPPVVVETLGAAWRPYATIACWYLWRSLDP